MARQLRIEYPGAFYHVTSRGNQKQAIFLTDADRYYFIQCLRDAYDKFGSVIHVYCLMNNHYHLLVETPMGDLSAVLHFINSVYTVYFNKTQERVGHLFQGRFKAILIQAEAYARELGPYIHLNPVRAELVDSPEQWPWSNYQEYLGTRNPQPWTSTSLILSTFAAKPAEARRRYVEYVIRLSSARPANPLAAASSSGILGKPEFVERIKQEFLNGKAEEDLRELPQLRRLRPKPQMLEVMESASRLFGPKNRHIRNAAIFIIHKNTDYRLREIGAFFKLSPSAINDVCRQFKRKLGSNEAVGRLVHELEDHFFRRKSLE